MDNNITLPRLRPRPHLRARPHLDSEQAQRLKETIETHHAQLLKEGPCSNSAAAKTPNDVLELETEKLASKPKKPSLNSEQVQQLEEIIQRHHARLLEEGAFSNSAVPKTPTRVLETDEEALLTNPRPSLLLFNNNTDQAEDVFENIITDPLLTEEEAAAFDKFFHENSELLFFPSP